MCYVIPQSFFLSVMPRLSRAKAENRKLFKWRSQIADKSSTLQPLKSFVLPFSSFVSMLILHLIKASTALECVVSWQQLHACISCMNSALIVCQLLNRKIPKYAHHQFKSISTEQKIAQASQEQHYSLELHCVCNIKGNWR